MRILLRRRPTTPSKSIVVSPMTVKVPTRPLRILDFDIENRPLSYLGSDLTTAEVTAVSWAWVDAPQDVTVYLLGEIDLVDILAAFVHAYNQADMVTGHFILGHDLPMLNGALIEQRMPALTDVLVQDTKVHMIRSKGISLSQESLGAMLRLDHQKVSMNQAKWRAANRLTAEGLAEVRERVTGDVRQHIELRRELLALNYLSKPTIWRSGAARAEAYVP